MQDQIAKVKGDRRKPYQPPGEIIAEVRKDLAWLDSPKASFDVIRILDLPQIVEVEYRTQTTPMRCSACHDNDSDAEPRIAKKDLKCSLRRLPHWVHTLPTLVGWVTSPDHELSKIPISADRSTAKLLARRAKRFGRRTTANRVGTARI